MAKLTKLTVENFKRIQAVEIEPEGNVTIVGGMNEQGKSSLLDSISVLLQGKATKIPRPVRTGAKKASITGEISSDSWDAFDDMTITRTITAAGNWYVKVQDKDGKAYKSPENMLKKIFGEPIDPVEFIKMSSTDRVETLKRITGLDFTDIDVKRKKTYDERILINREIKQMEGAVDEMDLFPNAQNEIVSISELMAELNVARKNNETNDSVKQQEKSIDFEINVYNEKISILKQKLSEAESTVKSLIEKQAEILNQINSLQYIDEEKIEHQINNAGTINNQIRENQEYENKVAELQKKQRESKGLTDKITALDVEKQEQLANIDLPVTGLSFDNNEVLYNNLPFDTKQLSSEELLRISFAISIAARPNLKNILIKEGSLLDRNNLKLIGQMAKNAGIHVFIETVGDDADKTTLIIENGKVKPELVVYSADDDFQDI